MVEQIAIYIAQPKTVMYFIGALVALASIFGVGFAWIVLRVNRALRRATVAVQRASGMDDFGAMQPKILDQIGGIFSGDRMLSKQWQRFRVQLSRNDDGTITSHRSPEVFFEPTILLEHHWLPLFRAAPSYLVGLGLVFTFLGIAVVIHLASLSLGGGDDLKALRSLLGAASLKFWTSLVGVFLSVLLAGCFRYLSARLRVSAGDFSYELSTRINTLTWEYSLHYSNVLLQQNIEMIRGARGEILQEIKLLRDGMQNITQATFSELVDQSSRQLSEAITKSLGDVARTFSDLNLQFQSVLKSAEALPPQFRTLSEDIGISMARVLKDIELCSSQLGKEFSKATASSGAIARDMDASAASAGNISAGLGSVQLIVDRVREALAELAAIGDIAGKLRETGEAIGAAAIMANTQLEQQAGHMSEVEKRLAGAVSTLPTVFVQYGESLKQFTDDLDGHLGRVLGSLSEQIESLEHVQTGLKDAISRIPLGAGSTDGRSPVEVL